MNSFIWGALNTPPQTRVRHRFSPWSRLTASSQPHITFARWSWCPYYTVSAGRQGDIYLGQRTRCCIGPAECNQSGPWSHGMEDSLGWFLSTASRSVYSADRTFISQYAGIGTFRSLPSWVESGASRTGSRIHCYWQSSWILAFSWRISLTSSWSSRTQHQWPLVHCQDHVLPSCWEVPPSYDQNHCHSLSV